MYPGPNVPCHGKYLNGPKYPYIKFKWIFMFFSSPRIPRLNTINTMGTLLGVHPSVPERKEHPGQPKKKTNTLICDLPKQQKMTINLEVKKAV